MYSIHCTTTWGIGIQLSLLLYHLEGKRKRVSSIFFTFTKLDKHFLVLLAFQSFKFQKLHYNDGRKFSDGLYDTINALFLVGSNYLCLIYNSFHHP